MSEYNQPEADELPLNENDIIMSPGNDPEIKTQRDVHRKFLEKQRSLDFDRSEVDECHVLSILCTDAHTPTHYMHSWVKSLLITVDNILHQRVKLLLGDLSPGQTHFQLLNVSES